MYLYTKSSYIAKKNMILDKNSWGRLGKYIEINKKNEEKEIIDRVKD